MNWNTPERQQLIVALLALRTRAEAQRFLCDLLTEAEIDDISTRLETAGMLFRGIAYPVIQKRTGFSTRTIARVSKWLRSGTGGYALILNRLHHAPASMRERTASA